MLEIAVISDSAAAESSLDPVRAQLLRELAVRASASMLSARMGIPRQRLNYHIRALEKHGLISLVEERKRGNMTERLYQATAEAYVISPSALPDLQPDPRRHPETLSAQWLLAVSARLVRDVGALIAAAAKQGRQVATFALDGEIRFATAGDRARFATELTDAVATLTSKYHDEKSPRGRNFQLVVAMHSAVPADGASESRMTP